MSLTQLKCLISAKADKDRKKTIKHEYRVPQLEVRIDKQTDSIANEADQEIGRYPILIWGSASTLQKRFQDRQGLLFNWQYMDGITRPNGENGREGNTQTGF